MDTTLTVEQQRAMEADMADFERAKRPMPLNKYARLDFQIIWMSGYKACLEEERNSIKARIEAGQRGGAQ